MKKYINRLRFYFPCLLLITLSSGCTVKAVGDPNRPITIQAHVTIDVRGLENTATSVEDYVSGKTDKIK